jgi:hypothetical protein
VARAEAFQRAADLFARFTVRALSGLRGDEEAVAGRTLQPRRDPQLRIAVAGGRVDVIDVVTQEQLEHAVGDLLRDL